MGSEPGLRRTVDELKHRLHIFRDLMANRRRIIELDQARLQDQHAIKTKMHLSGPDTCTTYGANDSEFM